MSTDPVQSANQPIPFKRDPLTGLVQDVVYRYTPEGLIDWRAMVPAKYLYVAKECEERVVRAHGKPLAEIDLLTVKDDWLRIRIGGLNHILHLRGARSVRYPTLQTREGFAAVVCEIELIPNIESSMQSETWSGIASACRTSMDVKMLPYLETFAENRAFGRAIKRALQINILSDIEVGGDARAAVEAPADDTTKENAVSGTPVGFHPYHELAELCRTFKGANGVASPISFEALQARAIKLNAETIAPNERVQADPATWKGFNDIQPIDAWLLIGKIKGKQKTADDVTKAKRPKP